jgi:uncharacterized membrane protein
MDRSNLLLRCAWLSLTFLILLLFTWEVVTYTNPVGAAWSFLKILPLMIILRKVLQRHIYTLQWSSMLVLLYFTEGVVQAWSNLDHFSRQMGLIEITLTLIYFFCSIFFLRPYKRIAKQKAKLAKEQDQT